MRTVLTYGTFDVFHIGHLRILERLRSIGDRLIVGVSTDEFNQLKGKAAWIRYTERAAIVSSLRCVDQVIPETCWEQKAQDIRDFGISILGMGDDWGGRFDHLSDLCEVVYLQRTEGISSTTLRENIAPIPVRCDIGAVRHSLRAALSLLEEIDLTADGRIQAAADLVIKPS